MTLYWTETFTFTKTSSFVFVSTTTSSCWILRLSLPETLSIIGILIWRPECLTLINFPNLSTIAEDCCFTIKNVPKSKKINNIDLLKIDTEGYELNVILGATETLKSTEFVLAEVRHNHESFEGVYKLHEFVNAMHDNGFVLSMIITAKPFIADLCFQPKNNL